MTDRRCPDCAVPMEEVRPGIADAGYDYVSTGETQEVLGVFETREKAQVTTVLCPECGLVRRYADLDAE